MSVIVALPDMIQKVFFCLWCEVPMLGIFDISLTNFSLRPNYIEAVSNMVLVQHIVYFLDEDERIRVLEKKSKRKCFYFAPKCSELFRKWKNLRKIKSSNISVHLDSNTRHSNEFAFDLTKIINIHDSSHIKKLNVYNIPATFSNYDLEVLSNISKQNHRICQRSLFITTINLCSQLRSLTMSSFGIDDRIITSINPQIMSNLNRLSLISTFENYGFTRLSATFIAKHCKNLVYLLVEFYLFCEIDESWNQDSIELVVRCNLNLLHIKLNNVGGQLSSILDCVIERSLQIMSIEVTDSNLSTLVCCNILTTLVTKCVKLKKIIFQDNAHEEYHVTYYDNTLNEYSVAPLGKGLFYRNYQADGMKSLQHLLSHVFGFVCVVLNGGYNAYSVRLLVCNNPKLEILVLHRVVNTQSVLSVSDLDFMLEMCSMLQLADGPQDTSLRSISEYIQEKKIQQCV
jgi:hypothetical protein